jgi:hypothetical protein
MENDRSYSRTSFTMFMAASVQTAKEDFAVDGKVKCN